ncbi:MAG: CHAT domain-containing protein [Planctomycetota bacterium]
MNDHPTEFVPLFERYVQVWIDAEYPWLSGLLLSAEDDAASGFLNTAEIVSLKLDAQLVFLSACETAKGKLVKGDSIRNTARSFLLAGARAVIATQWSVTDDAAVVQARTFYDRLFAGEPTAEALREAKLALIEGRPDGSRAPVASRGRALLTSGQRESRFAHPSFWAPFVLFGG